MIRKKMNHIKNIINTNIPRRAPSNIKIIQQSNYRSEVNIGTCFTKPRSPKYDVNSFILTMKKIHSSLVKTRNEGIRFGIDRNDIKNGQSKLSSKSIETLIKKLLSVINHMQKEVASSSNGFNLCYDLNTNYEGDRDERSYAQMITAYNDTLMTFDNAISDKLKSETNVRLSKKLSRTTSSLSSSSYNLENLTINESIEKTSMTDLSVDTKFDDSVEIDRDFNDKNEKRKKNFEINRSDITIPKTTTTSNRSYANIIADYCTVMDDNLISNKNQNYLPMSSMVSYSPIKFITPETQDLLLSPNLSTNSRERININQEIDWLGKVDNVIKNMKNATKLKDKKIDKNAFDFEETNVLQCVRLEEPTKIDKMKFTEATSRETSFFGDKKNEECLKYSKGNGSYRTEKIDGIKMSSQLLSSDYKIPTSSNLYSTFRKNSNQIPINTESNITNDPQVELRMVPSGNESIVSVNVEAIGKTTENLKNPNSKELSVIVSSNNKQTLSNKLPNNSRIESQSNFGSMRISISERSLPVKELELFINGKPISDVRSIKARTETLNVLTSANKVEIRVPYNQDNPNTINQSPIDYGKNVSNPESVLKLQIATAFNETSPIITSGNTKKVQQISTEIESTTPKTKSFHTEESNFNVIMSELSSTIKSQDHQSNIRDKSDVMKIEKSGIKKIVERDTIKDKLVQPKTDTSKRSNTSTLPNRISDDVNKFETISDIDLRFTKMFSGKAKVETDKSIESKDTSNKNERNIGNESFKDSNFKSVSSKTIKDKNGTDKIDIKKSVNSDEDNVKSLADIIAKHSGRRSSSDGNNSSAISGKSKPGANQTDGRKSPKSDKRDSKTVDQVINQSSILNERILNHTFKTDTLKEHRLSKQLQRSSDSYVKSKKEEDYQRNCLTYVTDKQMTNRTLASNDKIQSKLMKDSSNGKKSLTKSDKQSVEIKSNKTDKQYDVKDSKIFSKVQDVEQSSSTLKNENVDNCIISNNKMTTSMSPSNEENLDKRNEIAFKEKTKYVGTLKVEESTKKILTNEKRLIAEKKDIVEVCSKESSKYDIIAKNVDTKISPSPENVDKSMKSKNEQDVRSNEIKDSFNVLDKEKKFDKSSKKSKIKDLFNSMKLIEKKKDGILIDYGVKVASRKKQENTNSPIKDLTTRERIKNNNTIAIKVKDNQGFDNLTNFQKSNSINDSMNKQQHPRTNEESVKTKNVTIVQKTDEESKKPNDRTILQNSTKLSSTGRQNDVVKEKKKPKNISCKNLSKNTRESIIEREKKQRESSDSVDLLAEDTNKKDFSGSKDHSNKSSNTSNSNDNSNSFKKTKSYSTTSIDLIKSNVSDKNNCEGNNNDNNTKTRNELVNKFKRPEKDLVYSVWLQRKEETTTDDKKTSQ